MAFEQKPESGVLFPDDKTDKEGHVNESRPDFKGSALIGGVTYRVSAWKNESQKGSKYLGLKFTVKPAEGEAF